MGFFAAAIRDPGSGIRFVIERIDVESRFPPG
jgi:hypothetical protein